MDFNSHDEGGVKREGAKKSIFVILSILFILFITATAGAAYFFEKYSALRENPQQIAEEEAQKVVAKIGELIILPEGETPTVATVIDAERLKDQPFFARAQNGDRVVIYTNAQKVILYRPAEHKLIEVAPLNIGQ